MKGAHRKCEGLPERICPYCQAKFAPKQLHQRYCRPAHRTADANNRRASTTLVQLRSEVDALTERFERLVERIDDKCGMILEQEIARRGAPHGD